MNDPSAYDDWCTEVQARVSRDERTKDAIMLLRAFVRCREQGYGGEVSGIERAITLLESTVDEKSAAEGEKR